MKYTSRIPFSQKATTQYTLLPTWRGQPRKRKTQEPKSAEGDRGRKFPGRCCNRAGEPEHRVTGAESRSPRREWKQKLDPICLTILRGVLELWLKVCRCVHDWMRVTHHQERPRIQNTSSICTKINNRKPGKGFEWKLIKAETRKRWGKKRSSSVVIKKLQIKTIMRCYHKTDKTKCMWSNRTSHTPLVRESIVAPHGKHSGIIHVTY